MNRLLAAAGALLFLTLGAPYAGAALLLPVQESTFSSVTSALTGVVDLDAFDGPPAAVAGQLGASQWHGTADVSTTLNLGFRPTVEIVGGASGFGRITYDLGVSLGGLAGLEMPEANLWQRLTGQAVQANATYTLTVEIDPGLSLALSSFSNVSFGIGVAAGATSSSMGTMLADSLSAPAALTMTSLGGTAQRFTLTFTTGANPASGDLGVDIFAGRGMQALSLALSPVFKIDNVSLTVSVPEPRPLLMVVLGAGALAAVARPRRRVL